MRVTRDLVSGSSLLALAAVYLFAARKLPAGQNEPGPAFFPTLLAIALAVLALVIIWQGVDSRASRIKPETPKPFSDPTRPLLSIVWTGLYAAGLSPLGLVPSTLVYTLLMSRTLGVTSWRVLLIVPFASTLIVYVLFGWGFELLLPPPFWAS